MHYSTMRHAITRCAGAVLLHDALEPDGGSRHRGPGGRPRGSLVIDGGDRRVEARHGYAATRVSTASAMLNPRPVRARPISSRLALSSQCAMLRSPASRGRSPRLVMKAARLCLAFGSSPARNTSTGLPEASTWLKSVLNALITWVLSGAASAICVATELPAGTASPVASGVNGFVMST